MSDETVLQTKPSEQKLVTSLVRAPKVVKQNALCSTIKEANAVYRKAWDAGQRDISMAFDVATYDGIDSDNPQVLGDVDRADVAIDSVEDIKVLFDAIPLDQVSVSITTHGAVIPLLACLIVAAEEQGIDRSQLNGTLVNNILMGRPDRSAVIYPSNPSMRIVRDIIIYLGREMPGFNSISISGNHLHQAGANVVQELAYTLAKGKEYVKSATSKRLDVDAIAGHLSFTFAKDVNAATGAVKLRAAQLVWRRIMSEFNPNQPSSLMLPTECPALGSLCNEGSAIRLAGEVWKLIKKIDQIGSRAEAIIGLSNSQGALENGTENSVARDTQSARLKRLRETRDQGACDAALSMVEASANIDKGNLLELAVDAARARASLGEISMAMENSFGRHQAVGNSQGSIHGASPGMVAMRTPILGDRRKLT